jgi:hypothetical protein
VQEALAGLVILQFPCELLSAVVAGRWAAGASPFAPWCTAYILRLTAAAASTALVATFPPSASAFTEHPAAFVALAAIGLATSFSSTLMFTSLGSFYNRVSDPGMGGAYLTMLNTISNIGITLPKIGVFALMDALSLNACQCAPAALMEATSDEVACCDPFRLLKSFRPHDSVSAVIFRAFDSPLATLLQRSVLLSPESAWHAHQRLCPTRSLRHNMLLLCRTDATTAPLPDSACPHNQQAAQQPSMCSEAGGVCVSKRDGFYITSVMLLALGAALFIHFRRALPLLEGLPLDSWRSKNGHRHV